MFGCAWRLKLIFILAVGVCAMAANSAQQDFPGQRHRLVDELRRYASVEGIAGRSAFSETVLAAIGRVPRHLFVPPEFRHEAYANHPLPIGHGQTISQPYIVALMSDLLAVTPGDRILEVGTGSGYQAAVLAELGAEVHSIEIVADLARSAKGLLAELGYDSVTVYQGDGYRGLPDIAPFDGIIVTAAPDSVPPALIEQLKPGGRLVIPVGPQGGRQYLDLITRAADGSLKSERIIQVRFVPLVEADE